MTTTSMKDSIHTIRLHKSKIDTKKKDSNNEILELDPMGLGHKRTK
jgi:hypothetical protein